MNIVRVGQRLADGLGHAEVDDFGHGPIVVIGHQHVGRLQIAVDDSLLMGMLDCGADGEKQVESLLGAQLVLVAIAGDRDAFDQFHHEVRLAGVGCARFEHFGDVGMVHQRQGLALGLEAGDDLPGIHAGLDDFQRHFALDRLGLFGHINCAHAPFADLLQ